MHSFRSQECYPLARKLSAGTQYPCTCITQGALQLQDDLGVDSSSWVLVTPTGHLHRNVCRNLVSKAVTQRIWNFLSELVFVLNVKALKLYSSTSKQNPWNPLSLLRWVQRDMTYPIFTCYANVLEQASLNLYSFSWLCSQASTLVFLCTLSYILNKYICEIISGLPTSNTPAEAVKQKLNTPAGGAQDNTQDFLKPPHFSPSPLISSHHRQQHSYLRN